MMFWLSALAIAGAGAAIMLYPLLGADDRERGAEAQAGSAEADPRPRARVIAIALIGLFPLGALGLYARLGAPEALAPEAPEADASDTDQAEMIAAMVSRLAARLAQEPDDAQGWRMLGRSYRVLGQNEASVEAFARAVALLPDDRDAHQDYVQARLEIWARSQSSRLDPQTLAALRELLRVDPANPMALYFLGLDARAAGDFRAASDYWTRLQSLIPADAPQAEQIAKLLSELPITDAPAAEEQN